MTKGFGNLLKQAQQMHTKIAQLQEEMAGKTVEASSGGGMVNIVMNGKQEVLSVRIDGEELEGIAHVVGVDDPFPVGGPARKAIVPVVISEFGQSLGRE